MRMAAALLAVGTRCVAWEDPRGRVVRDVALDAVTDGIAGGWHRGGGVVGVGKSASFVSATTRGRVGYDDGGGCWVGDRGCGLVDGAEDVP